MESRKGDAPCLLPPLVSPLSTSPTLSRLGSSPALRRSRGQLRGPGSPPGALAAEWSRHLPPGSDSEAAAIVCGHLSNINACLRLRKHRGGHGTQAAEGAEGVVEGEKQKQMQMQMQRQKLALELEGALREASGNQYLRTIAALRKSKSVSALQRHALEAALASHMVKARTVLSDTRWRPEGGRVKENLGGPGAGSAAGPGAALSATPLGPRRQQRSTGHCHGKCRSQSQRQTQRQTQTPQPQAQLGTEESQQTESAQAYAQSTESQGPGQELGEASPGQETEVLSPVVSPGSVLVPSQESPALAHEAREAVAPGMGPSADPVCTQALAGLGSGSESQPEASLAAPVSELQQQPGSLDLEETAAVQQTAAVASQSPAQAHSQAAAAAAAAAAAPQAATPSSGALVPELREGGSFAHLPARAQGPASVSVPVREFELELEGTEAVPAASLAGGSGLGEPAVTGLAGDGAGVAEVCSHGQDPDLGQGHLPAALQAPTNDKPGSAGGTGPGPAAASEQRSEHTSAEAAPAASSEAAAVGGQWDGLQVLPEVSAAGPALAEEPREAEVLPLRQLVTGSGEGEVVALSSLALPTVARDERDVAGEEQDADGRHLEGESPEAGGHVAEVAAARNTDGGGAQGSVEAESLPTSAPNPPQHQDLRGRSAELRSEHEHQTSQSEAAWQEQQPQPTGTAVVTALVAAEAGTSVATPSAGADLGALEAPLAFPGEEAAEEAASPELGEGAEVGTSASHGPGDEAALEAAQPGLGRGQRDYTLTFEADQPELGPRDYTATFEADPDADPDPDVDDGAEAGKGGSNPQLQPAQEARGSDAYDDFGFEPETPQAHGQQPLRDMEEYETEGDGFETDSEPMD